MRFVTEEVIPRRPDEVYARLADFEGNEAAVVSYGVAPRRLPGTEGPEPAWAAEVPFRGKPRHIEVAVTRMTPPLALNYRLAGSSLLSDLHFALEALSGGRTRLDVTLDVRSEGISGRMLLHSLRLVRPTLVRRFRKRMRDYARYLGRA